MLGGLGPARDPVTSRSQTVRPTNRKPVGPERSAAVAQLRYVRDSSSGIRRVRANRGFRYLRSDGRPVRDLESLRRIKRLAIPPAWTDVWICPDPQGHLQAVGRDAKGRKQYRYHQRWRQVRDETKYARMEGFGRALPGIRAQVDRDISRPGLPRDKVLATVVRLLETTCIRIGNQEYARKNHSFGLTTLRNRHVKVAGSTLQFQFRGKGGKLLTAGVADRQLAGVLRRCQELPGYELFQYLDERGQPQTVDSSDVNEYLRRISGQDFTAKDFRTWAGTVAAARELRGLSDGQPHAAKRLSEAIMNVAQQLGNTPAICRRCYVHPAIIDAYSLGALTTAFGSVPPRPRAARRLEPDEWAVLHLIKGLAGATRAIPAARPRGARTDGGVRDASQRSSTRRRRT